jgi:hypothetical protein
MHETKIQMAMYSRAESAGFAFRIGVNRQSVAFSDTHDRAVGALVENPDAASETDPRLPEKYSNTSVMASPGDEPKSEKSEQKRY